MRRTLIATAVAELMLLIGILMLGTGVVHATTEHCPDGGAKTEAAFDGQLDEIVLDAGTSFCVKGSTDATGILTADGETTLFDYLNNGHNVSYYVVYESEASPSSSPSSTPTPSFSPEPSVEPTPTVTPTQSAPPSTTPSDEPTSEPSVEPTHTIGPRVTLPSTDTVSDTASVGIFAILFAVSFFVSFFLMTALMGRRR